MKRQDNYDQVYVVSGIQPSRKGAGKFISHFIDILTKENVNVKLFYLKTPENKIVKTIKRLGLIKPIKELYYYFKRRDRSLADISDSTIVLFHPQSLGLKNTKTMIENNDKIFYYVLDNFFFCKKSYNYINKENNACLRCIKNIDESLKNDCKPFPNYYSHQEYIRFIEYITLKKEKITFLTQNKNQTLLLKKMFGNNVSTIQLGMNTGEIEKNKDNDVNINFVYDFLYHNTLSYAKGLSYFISLCNSLPEYKFVIPYSKHDVESLVGKLGLSNLSFIPCTWNNGLLELINKTRITIVPSLWSAPVEGALLKSLYYSNAVAILRSNFSFADEIPADICIKLSDDFETNKSMLIDSIKNNTSLHDKSSRWVVDYAVSSDNELIKFAKKHLRFYK